MAPTANAPAAPMTEPSRQEAALLALSPLDGRYASKVDALRPIFSEYGLVRARVKVEIEWLLALAAEPGIAELAGFSAAGKATLRALAEGFSPTDAARVKEIECISPAPARTSTTCPTA